MASIPQINPFSFVPMTANTVYAPGNGIQLNASVAGTVTLTGTDGSTIVVSLDTANVDKIYPYSVIKWVAGTATVARVYNLMTRAS